MLTRLRRYCIDYVISHTWVLALPQKYSFVFSDNARWNGVVLSETQGKWI